MNASHVKIESILKTEALLEPGVYTAGPVQVFQLLLFWSDLYLPKKDRCSSVRQLNSDYYGHN